MAGPHDTWGVSDKSCQWATGQVSLEQSREVRLDPPEHGGLKGVRLDEGTTVGAGCRPSCEAPGGGVLRAGRGKSGPTWGWGAAETASFLSGWPACWKLRSAHSLRENTGFV